MKSLVGLSSLRSHDSVVVRAAAGSTRPGVHSRCLPRAKTAKPNRTMRGGLAPTQPCRSPASSPGATGDLIGKIEALRTELRRTRVDGQLLLSAISVGDPAGILPLLHFALLRSSRGVERWLSNLGYELRAKTQE